MKKLPVYLILFSAIIISSCASLPGVSVTKRNFRNGYYLDFISGKTTGTEAIKSDNLKEQPADLPVNIFPKDNLLNPSPLLAYAEKEPIPADKRKNEMKNTSILKKLQAIKTNNAKVPLIKIRYKSRPLIKPTMDTDNNTASINHEGGSIIWTLIGILLLLWLLSLLTGGWGLGGLIYLFLVVAVILAILRLLEVV